jgi:hypothetical protein
MTTHFLLEYRTSRQRQRTNSFVNVVSFFTTVRLDNDKSENSNGRQISRPFATQQ